MNTTTSTLSEGILYETPADFDGARWLVHLSPYNTTDPQVVRFCLRGMHRNLIDQTSRWNRDGWDPKRWVPKPPRVPLQIIEQVEAKLRELS